ncbi:cob(I)yrinic acid a,c-diamide adenosyltransferase [Leptolyngbya sp. AN10]|uniref:cob(I)yrinic acid a,c-diamide adenosyltransferase n=1 Tax=Leptolyngbya sp. AN10 TaxID=3423365 RepID=UPI003D314F0C
MIAACRNTCDIHSSIDHFNHSLGVLKIFTYTKRQFLTDVFAEALRIAGQGNKVLIAQLMKGGINQGQDHPSYLLENLHWIRCNSITCSSHKEINEPQRAATLELWEYVKSAILNRTYELVVLDELGLSIDLEIIQEVEVLSLVM